MTTAKATSRHAVRSREPLHFEFPLPRPHSGVALSNGRQGVLVWGDDRLCLTVAQNGFWDRRGGTPFADRIDFATLKRLLAEGREAEVRAAFKPPPGAPGLQHVRPTQLPGARVELLFEGDRPRAATLDLERGTLEIEFGAFHVVVRQSLQADACWVEIPAEAEARLTVRVIPGWQHPRVEQALRAAQVAPPIHRTLDIDGFTGEAWTQTLPQDPSLSVCCVRGKGRVVVTTRLGDDDAKSAIAGATSLDASAHAEDAERWWAGFWSRVPTVELPDPTLNRLHDYGLFKFAGLTHPRGVAATLQGGWMEEYQLPPWSNDYHFNINLQMCYWPALSANACDHLRPLWDLIRGWLPTLRTYGERFFGVRGAVMLPHATDDVGQAIGSFWQGTIDHASTAWIAYLAWLHYTHTLDRAVLEEVAYPLLAGAFDGFHAMLEEDAGGAFSLPVSVSPEYGEGAIGTWGRDASFQLAALHRVADVLPRAAAALGLPTDPRWAAVSDRLPRYALAPVGKGPWDDPAAPVRQRIALWRGQDLDHSHRHHSHLAGIYPFATLDHADPRERAVIEATLGHWQQKGAGEWCAWCLPWAACICARADRPDAALAWLHWLAENCANEGGNLSISGVLGAMSNWCGHDDARRKPGEHFEIMQLDANMGIVTAIHELLVQSTEDELRVMNRLPWRWKSLRFDGIRAAGAFLVGGTVEAGRPVSIRIASERGGTLRMRHPWRAGCVVDGRHVEGPLLTVATLPGQSLELRPPA